MSRGGVRAALIGTAAVLVLLGAMAVGSRGFSWWLAAGCGAACVLVSFCVGFVVRTRKRAPAVKDGRAAAVNQVRDVPGVALMANEINRVEFHRHPPQAWTAPRLTVGGRPPRASAYQNRAVLDELASGWRSGVVVLQGLAGVGKTQVATEYADRMREICDVAAVVWVDATSRDTILCGLGEAAEKMFGADGRDVWHAARMLLDGLDSTDRRWVLVLDDLQDLDGMTGLWPAHTPHGQVVVTTRLRDAAIPVDGARVIDVRPFTVDEAVAFLAESLARRPEQAYGAEDLADAMECHPLGLAHAAAYLAEHHDETCATYRVLFERRRATRSGGLPDVHRAAIAATWSLSIERADQVTGGLARRLLTLAAVLHGHGVPAGVFGRGTTVRNTLSCLHRLGLITYDPRTPDRAVRVHILVQRAVYDSLTRHEIAKVARVAADALLAVWPPVECDPELAAVLRANATALRKAVGLRLRHARVRELWNRLGGSLGESGQAMAARHHFQELVVASWRTFGPLSHVTLRARFCLAHWRGETRDAAGAVAALRQLIEDAPQLFRRQRMFVLRVRRALAHWLAVARHPEDALAEINSVIDALDDDHPETLYARNIRVRCLVAVGRPGWAVTEMAALLEDFRSRREPDDPDVLSARNNLAGMRHFAGDHAAAIAEYTALLPDLHRVFGSYHPKTLCTRNNLARCRVDARDVTLSVADLRLLVADCDRVLGPSHPETLAAWNTLSRSFTSACG